MARDRFVYWPEGKKVLTPELLAFVSAYGRGIFEEEMYDAAKKRIFVTLPGKTSHRPGLEPGRRYFEICVNAHCIDVITRMTDDITNAIADGLAWAAKSKWNGRLDDR